ncbi:MAG: putative molybdenum cofactor guanylyltransferase [Planctomycetota bacterium]|jgi:molybdopterin-guanine dinucleotide biosynthesis protein A
MTSQRDARGAASPTKPHADLARRTRIADNPNMRCGAILLTGGMSLRMGRAKEHVLLGGVSMLARAVATVAIPCAPVVVVARDARQELPPLPPGTLLVADDHPGAGPLAGFATGLRRLAALPQAPEATLLGACDMPFLQPRELAGLVAELAASPLVMPSDDDGPQPMVGAYRIDLLPTIEALLAAGKRSLRALNEVPGARVLTAAESRQLSPRGDLWRSVNTPEQLLAAEAESHDRR